MSVQGPQAQGLEARHRGPAHLSLKAVRVGGPETQSGPLSDCAAAGRVGGQRPAEGPDTPAWAGRRPEPPELRALPQGLRPQRGPLRAGTSPSTGLAFLSNSVTSSRLPFLSAVFGNPYNRTSAKVPPLFTSPHRSGDGRKKDNSSRAASPQPLRRLQTPNGAGCPRFSRLSRPRASLHAGPQPVSLSHPVRPVTRERLAVPDAGTGLAPRSRGSARRVGERRGTGGALTSAGLSLRGPELPARSAPGPPAADVPLSLGNHFAGAFSVAASRSGASDQKNRLESSK